MRLTIPPLSGRRILAVVSAGALTAAVSGCGAAGGASGGGAASSITIAYQPGVGYAPLLIMKQQRVLEKKFPKKKIQWKLLNSGAAIRDAMISKNVQVGAGGIGPFLVGWSNGLPWKIVMSLDEANLYLMSKKYNSLASLKGQGKIAMPGPDSIQSVVLRKAAQKQLGDAKALDPQIVSMGHPDGVQALVSGQIAAHLTSPPFQGEELKAGAHPIVKSYDVFGEHTFNSVFVLSDFYKANPTFMKAFETAVANAANLLATDPDQASQVLSQETGGKIPASQMKEETTGKDITYSTKPLGFMVFGTFMKQIGLIKKVPSSASGYFFANSYTSGGS